MRSERSARATCSPAPDEHVAHLGGLLHRRLDPEEAHVVGGLLGEVDDVVEGGGQLVAVDGVHRGALAVAALEAVDDVVRDAVALVLAEDQLAREVGALGVVDEEVSQQERRALDVAPALLEEHEYLVVRPGTAYESHQRNPSPRARRGCAAFTGLSQRVYRRVTSAEPRAEMLNGPWKRPSVPWTTSSTSARSRSGLSTAWSWRAAGP